MGLVMKHEVTEILQPVQRQLEKSNWSLSIGRDIQNFLLDNNKALEQTSIIDMEFATTTNYLKLTKPNYFHFS